MSGSLESPLDAMAPSSTASTKAERNRRKRKNAKKRKAEEVQKAAAELELLAKMSSLALKERVLDSAGEGDSELQLDDSKIDDSSPPEQEVNEKSLGGSSS